MFKKILFIHHSTGGNLIKEGNLREEIRQLSPNVQFWDHSYNFLPILANFTHLKGLSDNAGKISGTDYNIVVSNNIKYYKIIRDNLKKYPSKQFVVLTPPPARKETTNLENSERAKKLVDWLNSKEFSQDIPNIHVFDFYSLLADKDGFLKKEYTRLLPWDSHPNKKANKIVAPIFANYLVNMSV